MNSDRSGSRPTDAGDGVRPWPGWLRVVLLSVLVLWVGVGLVVLLYSKGILPIAGPFVALLAGPLIAVLGLRWRARRAVTALDGSLHRAAEEIDEQRAEVATRRSSGLSDASLALLGTRVAEARTALEAGDLGRGVSHVDALVPQLRAEVGTGSPLASAVDEIESARSRLGKVAGQARARS